MKSARNYAGLAVIFTAMVFVLSGCSTVPKKFKEEVSGIKSKVDTLESRVEGVETKQSETERLAGEQAQDIEALKARKTARTNFGVKPHGGKSATGVKETQTCLKNAGFYSGKIDGVMGKKTRKAVKEFQKANGLSADGIVGKKTSELLSKYAHGAAGESTGGSEEVAVK